MITILHRFEHLIFPYHPHPVMIEDMGRIQIFPIFIKHVAKHLWIFLGQGSDDTSERWFFEL